MKRLVKALMASVFAVVSAGQAPATEAPTLHQARTFNSDGHPKANGLSVSLKYPHQWKQKEGERPHIVQQFVGSGGANCNLHIVDTGVSVSEADLKDLVQSADFEDLVPEGAVFIAGQVTTLDGLPAAELIFQMPISRGGLTVTAKAVSFSTFYFNSAIQFMCAAPRTAKAPELFESHLLLYRRIAASIVIHDRWKGGAVALKEANVNDVSGARTGLGGAAGFLVFCFICAAPAVLARWKYKGPVPKKAANWLAAASAVPLGALFVIWFKPESDNAMGILVAIAFFVLRWLMASQATGEPGELESWRQKR